MPFRHGLEDRTPDWDQIGSIAQLFAALASSPQPLPPRSSDLDVEIVPGSRCTTCICGWWNCASSIPFVPSSTSASRSLAHLYVRRAAAGIRRGPDDGGAKYDEDAEALKAASAGMVRGFVAGPRFTLSDRGGAPFATLGAFRPVQADGHKARSCPAMSRIAAFGDIARR